MTIVPSILIGVDSLDKSRAFYENVFEITFEEFRPPFACFSLGGIEFNIEENADYRSDGREERYIGGHKAVSFNVDDIDSFLDKVVKNGGEVVQNIEEKPRGYKEAKIADISGNIFIVDEKMKIEGSV